MGPRPSLKEATDRLRNVEFEWHGYNEATVGMQWEAAFMDAAANRPSVSADADASAAYGDRAKVLSLQMLTVFFPVLRCVAGDAPHLVALADRVAARLHTRAYWVDRWGGLCTAVAAAAGPAGVVAANRIGTASFKAATRAAQDADMGAVVDIREAHPLDAGGLCGVPSCWLATVTTMQVWRALAPPPSGGGGEGGVP